MCSNIPGRVILILELPWTGPSAGFLKRDWSATRMCESGWSSLLSLLWPNTLAPWAVANKFSSVLFSRSVMSDSLWPHGLQHSRLPCPSPTPAACSNSCPSRWWCHQTISSSAVPFSSHLQSFPASGSFPMSQFFTSGGQSIGVSTTASVLPMNIQDWFPLGWTG